MRFLDVIGPGDPGYYDYPVDTNYIPAIIIGSVVVVIAIVLIIAALIKNKDKKK